MVFVINKQLSRFEVICSLVLHTRHKLVILWVNSIKNRQFTHNIKGKSSILSCNTCRWGTQRINHDQEAFFSHLRKCFSKFQHKIFIILSFGAHNPQLCCVICTGVTLSATVLHLKCTALSQWELSNFFMYIIRPLKTALANYK